MTIRLSLHHIQILQVLAQPDAHHMTFMIAQHLGWDRIYGTEATVRVYNRMKSLQYHCLARPIFRKGMRIGYEITDAGRAELASRS